MAIRILVVEDDTLLQDCMVRILRSRHYHVVVAANLRDAALLFNEESPDIVLLDIMLPDGKGYEMIPQWKTQAKVIIVTALTDLESKYLCYEYGAEDYLTKDFDMQELLYKLEVVERNLEKSEWVIGDIVVDRKSQRIVCKECSLDIPRSQIHLLCLLEERRKEHRMVAKDEVAPDRHYAGDGDAGIQNLVARLRKKTYG